ncbi:hypothetical protein Noda2021_05430 [Candidatus Dependentiae bacterium Noda2021]|nr:hypothetical protein Noda2021_05430 [Candidatus Dependentiae bacterium Noda2021]
MEQSLTAVLKDHFAVSKRQLKRQRKRLNYETIGVKKIELINQYVLKVVRRTVKHASNVLKQELVNPQQIDGAAKVLRDSAHNAITGIVTKKIRVKRSSFEMLSVDLEKLVKFYPENLKEMLLNECEGIRCPICYNYFKEEFKNPDKSMVDRMVLDCNGKHAFCPDDIFSYFTRHHGTEAAENCPICFTPHHLFDAAK